MNRLTKGAMGAALTLAPLPALAQIDTLQDHQEIAVGVLRHGANFHPLGGRLTFDLPPLPDGQVYEGMEENGTTNVQIAYRTAPLPILLKPRLTAKAEINTGGRTSFFGAGAEWRQHAFRGRAYAQAGIGVTLIDGYAVTPDPFEPGISPGQARQRYGVYLRRTSFGSQVLFNPNASIGIRLDRRWAVEAVWEHFSHAQVFSERNPGIDNVGIRLVRALGR
jgi:hypothetical protein